MKIKLRQKNDSKRQNLGRVRDNCAAKRNCCNVCEVPSVSYAPRPLATTSPSIRSGSCSTPCLGRLRGARCSPWPSFAHSIMMVLRSRSSIYLSLSLSVNYIRSRKKHRLDVPLQIKKDTYEFGHTGSIAAAPSQTYNPLKLTSCLDGHATPTKPL